MMKNILMLVAILVICSSQEAVETETLSVKQINEDGFGDDTNQYAFAMESFQGKLYVATLNSASGLFPGMALFFLGMEFESNGVQIWEGSRGTGGKGKWTWTQVLKDGNGNKNNYGIRKIITIGEYMYCVTANHADGFELWRSKDGQDWEVIRDKGFGDSDNTSGRGLLAYGGYIYIGSENRNTGAKIFRRRIELNGDFADGSDFEQVVDDGLGDTNNIWFSDFVAYKGYMYLGTLNGNPFVPGSGMELHRTVDGVDYEKIFDHGNGNVNEMAAMKLYVYRDDLYIGTMNFVEGASLYVSTDDDGKVFGSIFTKGNGDWNNAYVWYMQEFNDRLYAGTFKTFGEFDLISAEDPKGFDFVTETDDAFGNEYQYGIRTMEIHEGYLMIGSATARKQTGCQVYEATVCGGGDTVGETIVSGGLKEMGKAIVEEKSGKESYKGVESINWIMVGVYVGILTVVFNVMIYGCKYGVVNKKFIGGGKEKYVTDL